MGGAEIDEYMPQAGGRGSLVRLGKKGFASKSTAKDWETMRAPNGDSALLRLNEGTPGKKERGRALHVLVCPRGREQAESVQ